jgi:putative acyl-CoA dehydrogenase
VPTIIEMVNLTRLDCALGSATSMRNGLARAMHHTRHRKAFGAKLIDQPLMRNVLADMAVEAEAATMLAMRMAGATDRAVRGDDRETLLRRIGLAAGKYWVCKRATAHAAEAMEVLRRQRVRRGVRHAAAVPRSALMGIWEGPETSAHWIRCAPWQPGPNASTCCSTNWPSRPVRIRAWPCGWTR